MRSGKPIWVYVSPANRVTEVTDAPPISSAPRGSWPRGSGMTEEPATAAVALALLSASGYESEGGGFHIVEGEVKNISDGPIENVQVVATWYDSSGGFIKSDSALIEYNPLLPGQTSPFKTITSSNPAMKRYKVEFKSLFGGTIGTEVRRKR